MSNGKYLRSPVGFVTYSTENPFFKEFGSFCFILIDFTYKFLANVGCNN